MGIVIGAIVAVASLFYLFIRSLELLFVARLVKQHRLRSVAQTDCVHMCFGECVDEYLLNSRALLHNSYL